MLHSYRVRLHSFRASIFLLGTKRSRVYATYSAHAMTYASPIGPPSVLAFNKQQATSALNDATIPSTLLRCG